MSTLHKMKVLTDSAQYDLCDYVNHQKSSQVNLPGIYHATGHNGCQIPLFKHCLQINAKMTVNTALINPKELSPD